MSLIPEIQSQVDEMFKQLSLSETRQAVLQPLIEKKIQVGRKKPDGENDNTVAYQVDIIDGDGNKRDIKISQLVAEIQKATPDNSIPLVENKNLSEAQMKLISEGKLGIKEHEETHDKDAIPASKILDNPPSLDDVSSGKVRVDIDA